MTDINANTEEVEQVWLGYHMGHQWEMKVDVSAATAVKAWLTSLSFRGYLKSYSQGSGII